MNLIGNGFIRVNLNIPERDWMVTVPDPDVVNIARGHTADPSHIGQDQVACGRS